MFLRACAAALIALSSPALAEVPRVVTDIAPVHSLVSQVMGTLGQPTLLVPPGASPHGHAMRPSEARALNAADLVVIVGHDLTPWLDGPITALGDTARLRELIETEGTLTLMRREGITFEDHDDHEDGHDDHAHDHDSPIDPHAWLDPANAGVWLAAIAEELATKDPDNAATYHANAQAAQARMAELTDEIAASLPARAKGYIVFHDAYHYFENRFGLQAAGAISLSTAAPPSARRLATLKSRLADLNVGCAFTEPQFNDGVIRALDEAGMTIASLDPLGTAFAPGPDHYAQTLRALASAFAGCLGD